MNSLILKAITTFVLGTLLTVAQPALAHARASSVFCGGVHTPRLGNTEILDTSISFRNTDFARGTDVRITRLTIRDFFGNVVGDFGEGATPAADLPKNKDFSPAVDITTVPAGANYYLTTTHIYGTTFLSTTPGAGSNISIVVEFSTAGDPDLFLIRGSVRVVELIGGLGGTRGQEHTRSTVVCSTLK